MRALALVALLALAACWETRGSFDGTIYMKSPVVFRVGPVPAGWEVIPVKEASLAFRDPAHAASVLVNARCESKEQRTPLVALTNQLLIGATQREIIDQAVEPLDDREALHTRLRAKWDGVLQSIDVYVLSKDGCIYDFVYVGDPAHYEMGAAAFESFVRGFHTLPGSGVV